LKSNEVSASNSCCATGTLTALLTRFSKVGDAQGVSDPQR
jgi:hypothetical protein